MFLAGTWVGRPQTIEVRNPQDDSLISTVPAATKEDALYAVEQAKEGADIIARMAGS